MITYPAKFQLIETDNKENDTKYDIVIKNNKKIT
jgi:hypothetical protein